MTATVADPDLVLSCIEVATTVAVPADAGVNMPVLLMFPIFEGLTDQSTELSNDPVPDTIAEQVDV